MPNEKKDTNFITRTSLFAVLQIIVPILIYGLVIVILCVYIRGNVSKLHQELEHLKSYAASTECICNSAQHKNTNDANDNQNLLQCCSANQETLLMMISTILEEEKRRWNREYASDGNQLTLGAIGRYVEYLLNRNRTSSQPSSGSGNSVPVATHVTGTSGCFGGNKVLETFQTGSTVKVGRWEATYGTAFNENVLSDGHHLIVPKSGLYHVYSQAYFQDYREDDQEDTEYVHYTVLDSPSYSADTIDLMKSVRIEDGISNYYSSFHSGLFKLREGDKIFMKVYLPSSEVELDCSQESTYMGMYLVNDNLII